MCVAQLAVARQTPFCRGGIANAASACRQRVHEYSCCAIAQARTAAHVGDGSKKPCGDRMRPRVFLTVHSQHLCRATLLSIPTSRIPSSVPTKGMLSPEQVSTQVRRTHTDTLLHTSSSTQTNVPPHRSSFPVVKSTPRVACLCNTSSHGSSVRLPTALKHTHIHHVSSDQHHVAGRRAQPGVRHRCLVGCCSIRNLSCSAPVSSRRGLQATLPSVRPVVSRLPRLKEETTSVSNSTDSEKS
jgi:hypothetical protein